MQNLCTLFSLYLKKLIKRLKTSFFARASSTQLKLMRRLHFCSSFDDGMSGVEHKSFFPRGNHQTSWTLIRV